MIAEYERAQILERSRRGKRHRAREGQISVLSGAPFGYRYIRKSDQTAAYYQVIEAEAEIVRMVYERYTVQGLSIGAIARLLSEQKIPARRAARWERSVVWAMLRNPAYKGTACFGKTKAATRQRITRPLRLRGGVAARDSAGHERSRDEWIEIPVPAIVSETTFALAQERLQDNKKRAPRRTIEPSIVPEPGILRQVRLRALSHIDAIERTDDPLLSLPGLGRVAALRWLGLRQSSGPPGPSRCGRVERDRQAIEDPGLIQAELDRRLEAARHADPTKRRVDALQRDLIRTKNSLDRLVTAFQEELISLDDLRQRSPALRQREHAIRGELQAIPDQANDRAATLRLAETLAAFLGRLRVVGANRRRP